MEGDPDYIEPAVLKRRAAVSGGAGARSGRPTVHRVDEPRYGLRLADGLSGVIVAGSSTITAGVDVHKDVEHVVIS